MLASLRCLTAALVRGVVRRKEGVGGGAGWKCEENGEGDAGRDGGMGACSSSENDERRLALLLVPPLTLTLRLPAALLGRRC